MREMSFTCLSLSLGRDEKESHTQIHSMYEQKPTCAHMFVLSARALQNAWYSPLLLTALHNAAPTELCSTLIWQYSALRAAFQQQLAQK